MTQPPIHFQPHRNPSALRQGAKLVAADGMVSDAVVEGVSGAVGGIVATIATFPLMRVRLFRAICKGLALMLRANHPNVGGASLPPLFPRRAGFHHPGHQRPPAAAPATPGRGGCGAAAPRRCAGQGAAARARNASRAVRGRPHLGLVCALLRPGRRAGRHHRFPGHLLLPVQCAAPGRGPPPHGARLG